MDKPLKTPPPCPIASVDHALRAATMLQMEGGATESQIAARPGVARSTAHRVPAMLVYRDFAMQDEDRVYRAGPVLELAAHSQSLASRLRAAALPHLHRIVGLLDETANLIVRTGDTTRFIAGVECRQALRVGSREGMVFPAHHTTAGLPLLAGLSVEELDEVYAPERYRDRPADRPDLARLQTELRRLRRNGFAVNKEKSERGLVAVGVPVRSASLRPNATKATCRMPSTSWNRLLPSRGPTASARVAGLDRHWRGLRSGWRTRHRRQAW
ncbi:IclR family transcriptional regulator [Streptomyces sp. GbtcB6]|uniref:IclR family transcriptional regulator n=1 Tax=Streptomyces sp. GbtcB6 TaxID=2824751 RepID=UPI001C30561C|nr:IclR family transcriptional regulator C-terminal domain-containing protein [Streptomyces sp. GbtcB6]